MLLRPKGSAVEGVGEAGGVVEVWVLVEDDSESESDCEVLAEAGPVSVAVGGALPAPMMPPRPSCEA